MDTEPIEGAVELEVQQSTRGAAVEEAAEVGGGYLVVCAKIVSVAAAHVHHPPWRSSRGSRAIFEVSKL